MHISEDVSSHDLYCSQYKGINMKSCGEYFYNALADSYKKLQNMSKSESLEWGNFHKAVYGYGPFGKSDFLKLIGFADK
jgi:hypothetical protein